MLRRIRTARGLATIGLAAGLAYLLYPVGYRVQGVGVLQPSVESLIPVPAPISDIVSRVDVRPPSAVTLGLPLLAVVPMREAGVLTEATIRDRAG